MNRARELILSAPELYIGKQWDENGLYFLLSEVMKLAIQPESANQSSNLRVVIEDESVLSIMDDGRGLPVEAVSVDQSIERPRTEHVFSWIVTSKPSSTYYEKFGFLDYRGFVLNAVSERLQVETHFEGYHYELICMQGEIISRLRRTTDMSVQDKGTRLTFMPDPALFPNFRFDFESLRARLGELKREFPSVTIRLEDKRSNQEVEIVNQT